MKVNIQIDPALSEEYVEFHVRAITNEISRYASIIEKSDRVITGTDQFDRITIVDPNEIVAVHADKKWCRIYTNNADFSCRKRLFELEEDLGPYFMRISKSFVVNIR